MTVLRDFCTSGLLPVLPDFRTSLRTSLFIKILLVSLELSLAPHAALPPRLDEATAIAHELGESGTDRQKTDAYTVVGDRRIEEDEQGVED